MNFEFVSLFFNVFDRTYCSNNTEKKEKLTIIFFN